MVENGHLFHELHADAEELVLDGDVGDLGEELGDARSLGQLILDGCPGEEFRGSDAVQLPRDFLSIPYGVEVLDGAGQAIVIQRLPQAVYHPSPFSVFLQWLSALSGLWHRPHRESHLLDAADCMVFFLL